MLFSRTSEYALRAVAHLASVTPQERLSSASLAESTQIPTHYVAKVMRKLVRGGIIDAQSGKRGGFKIARPPAAIRFIDVLVAMDDLPDAGRCAFGFAACDPDQPCSLHPAWGQLRDYFFKWATETTFAEMGPNGTLPQFPGLPPTASAPLQLG